MSELVETPVVEFTPVFYPPTSEIHRRGATAGDVRDYICLAGLFNASLFRLAPLIWGNSIMGILYLVVEGEFVAFKRRSYC
ncbi:hypothetical protein [Eggerthella sp. YY7918]|uniref:hypothetical protein n=1 Tax=Eggerthella sp. (strain YY7918) TaxID=502558 RepID=UPI0012471511|nr:hypothetical protein [Eggerthella sp. YY7918]